MDQVSGMRIHTHTCPSRRRGSQSVAGRDCSRVRTLPVARLGIPLPRRRHHKISGTRGRAGASGAYICLSSTMLRHIIASHPNWDKHGLGKAWDTRKTRGDVAMGVVKVLFSGPVEGRLEALFARVKTVNASSGPFDALFCVGQFFADGAWMKQHDVIGRCDVGYMVRGRSLRVSLPETREHPGRRAPRCRCCSMRQT